MDFSTAIGIAASVFTGTSLLPQLVKIIREKKADDISLGMLGILFAGLSFWVYYGVLKDDWIIIVSNGFSMMVNLATGAFSFFYKNK